MIGRNIVKNIKLTKGYVSLYRFAKEAPKKDGKK